MRGTTVADLTGANFHYMIDGRVTLCGKNVPAAWRLSDYTINCEGCAQKLATGDECADDCDCAECENDRALGEDAERYFDHSWDTGWTGPFAEDH